CEQESTLNKEYKVTDQGVILVDFIGAVKVEGLTEEQAAKKVSDQLVNDRILRQATVKIKIVEATVEPITFKGTVKATGQEPYRPGIRLADIVRTAQPLPDTDLTRIEVRSKDGKSLTFDFTRFDPATNDNNPPLQPGDTVTFYTKSAPGLVIVLGGVVNPGGVTYARGMTVRSAIAKAGGYADMAVQTAVKLERKGQSTRTIDMTKATNDVAVQEGDRIIVDLVKERRYVQVNGAVMKGGFIEFKPGMTLKQAIAAGGGMRNDAERHKIRLIRGSTPTVYDYDKLVSGAVADPPLEAGDRVLIDGHKARDNTLLQSLTALALLFILIGK
ncbi:MAG TPA: SLBB domain-containing protein, partial [Fimbriimonadaceae bacterium]|nr:SLBB domain-containing protein [Fimbriimonadaceae bacterium]